MASITTTSILGETDTFEVVDSIPPGYFVWNIGGNMGTDEYIPLCRSLYPGLPKDNPLRYHIDADFLKAIKLPREEVTILREAAANGISSLEEAQKAAVIKVRGKFTAEKQSIAVKALPIFQRITAGGTAR